jgi:glyoxylase-like metal-dependent hydrolase (beta-lactamase superfamily II)
MGEATQSWKVGQVRVTSVVEAQTDGIPPQFFFPDASAEAIRQHGWIAPRFGDTDGNIGLRVQAFVLEVDRRLVVVDPCVGNGKTRESPFWNEQNWPFMDRFRAAGFDPAEVDLVVYTHLHVDHVGWSTHRIDGRWVPTFTRARHLFVGPELEYLRSRDEPDPRAIDEDSIAPVFDAGLAELIEIDADLGSGLRLEPTVGHTPGHASLWIESGGETAVITGDFIHHPVQCAEPALAFVSDADRAQAERTRRAMLARLGEGGELILGTHFPTAPAGHVVPDPDRDAWVFRPEQLSVGDDE